MMMYFEDRYPANFLSADQTKQVKQYCADLGHDWIEFPFGIPDHTQDVLWRVEESHYSSETKYIPQYPFYYYQRSIVGRHIPVVKRTEQGAWIVDDRYDAKNQYRFILLTARKKYAAETIEQAIESFIARQYSQIEILTNQLEQAMVSLSVVKNQPLTPEQWMFLNANRRSRS